MADASKIAIEEECMRKVLCLAGLPGVGKSKLAGKIATQVSGVILDVDNIKRRVVDPTLVSTTVDPPDIRWKCYEMAIEEIFAKFDQGEKIIIVDEVFHLQSLRQQLEDACSQRGAHVDWIEVRCEYEIVQKRLAWNGRDNDHLLSVNQTLCLYRRFEKLFEDFPAGKKNHAIFYNENERALETFTL